MTSKTNSANSSAGTMKEIRMSRLVPARRNGSSCGKFIFILTVIALASVGCGKSRRSGSTAEAPSAPQTFATPDLAGQAIYSAAKAGDTGGLLTIFGSGAKELLLSGDPVQDKSGLETFIRQYDEMHRWAKLTHGGLVLDVGAENYPFPFALKKNEAGQWYFDASSAKEEILARRIGGNELSAIDVLNTMNIAQGEYFSQLHDGVKARTYAQKFVSDEGKQNGLYWHAADGESDSPLGPFAAFATSEGYANPSQQSQPYHGYFFRMLTSQGPEAKGGAKNYVVDGHMIGGFAALAYPAEYGNSGVMSFLINQDGGVFQKDLGADTATVAKTMSSFNPDNTWTIVE
jgi:hypothetical protein